MGTRNLTIVKLDGELKVAQYCQWDGYPGGVGKDIAQFLKGLSAKGMFGNKLEAFKNAVRELEWATPEEIEAAWSEVGADGSGLVNMKVSDKAKKNSPEFHRDTGPGILYLIQKGLKRVQNSIAFLDDKVFCEWAYEIDLTEQVVRVYVYKTEKPVVIPFKDFINTKKMMAILEPQEE